MADVHGPDAVDERVMRLGRYRPAPALKSLQEHRVPQGAVAVETLGPVVPGPLEKLGIPSRGGQCRVADVLLDPEVRVGLPRGPAKPAGVWLREPTAVGGQRAEPSLEVLVQASRRGRRPRPGLEDHHGADVHVRRLVGLLELQEGGIER